MYRSRNNKPVAYVFSRRTMIPGTKRIAHVGNTVGVIKELAHGRAPSGCFRQSVMRGHLKAAGEAVVHREGNSVVTRPVVGTEYRDVGSRRRQCGVGSHRRIGVGHILIPAVLMNSLLV